MARLRSGEKRHKERRVQTVLCQHEFGLREAEIASELGWDRRTVNNYLRDLNRQGRAYKEGRDVFPTRVGVNRLPPYSVLPTPHSPLASLLNHKRIILPVYGDATYF